MTPPHNGSRPSSTAAARWKTARKYGPYAAAISGSLANAIQILTVETPTTAGLVISGIVIATCLPLATFLTGRSHGRRKAVALTKEIQGLQGVLEATFGSISRTTTHAASRSTSADTQTRIWWKSGT